MSFWQSARHELGFVLGPDSFVEAKRGRSGPMDVAWFPNTFPKARLTVIGGSRFETDRVVGVTPGDSLLAE